MNFVFVMVPVVFLLVFGVIIYGLIVSISQWNKNNKSSVLTVDASVVSKRMDVTHHHNNAGDNSAMHVSSSTSYYVTFQVQSGDRLELLVRSSDYGMIVEGDYGQLTFQGTRFLNFNRVMENNV